MNTFWILVLVVIISFLIFYVFFKPVHINFQKKGCSNCEQFNYVCDQCRLINGTNGNNGSNGGTPIGSQGGKEASQKLLEVLTQSCSQRLVAIAKESDTKVSDIREFLGSGFENVVIVSDLDLPQLIDMMQSDNVSSLKLVGISSKKFGNSYKYLAVAVDGDNVIPLGRPVDDFETAFIFADKQIRKLLGNDNSNLVFYIDESIPCNFNIYNGQRHLV